MKNSAENLIDYQSKGIQNLTADECQRRREEVITEAVSSFKKTQGTLNLRAKWLKDLDIEFLCGLLKQEGITKIKRLVLSENAIKDAKGTLASLEIDITALDVSYNHLDKQAIDRLHQNQRFPKIFDHGNPGSTPVIKNDTPRDPRLRTVDFDPIQIEKFKPNNHVEKKSQPSKDEGSPITKFSSIFSPNSNHTTPIENSHRAPTPPTLVQK